MSMDPRQVKREIARVWSALRLTDRARLSKRRRAFLDLLDRDPEAAEPKREEFFQLLASAQKRSLVPVAERIRCEFPDTLPITAKIPEIRAALKDHVRLTEADSSDQRINPTWDTICSMKNALCGTQTRPDKQHSRPKGNSR